MQVADVLFGSQAGQYDYLQETLLRLLSIGWLGAAAQNLVNTVSGHLCYTCNCMQAPLV